MKAHFERTPRQQSGARGQLQTGSAGPHGQAASPALPPALPKTALLWGIAPDHPALAPLRAAGRLGLALRTVAPQELNATVGALCGIPGAAEKSTHAAGRPAKAAGSARGAGAAARPIAPAVSTALDAPVLPGSAAPLPAAPKGPALILCGLPGPERDALLDALRDAGAVIPLKAIVTPTNQGWHFSALLAELAREHAALQGRAE